MGHHSGYWGDLSEITCAWEPAVDRESGIAGYHVRLIKVTPVCGERPTERLGGDLVGDVYMAGCSETNVSFVQHALHHSARYHCIVTVVNGAGLANAGSSADTLIDGSMEELHERLTTVEIVNELGDNVSSVSNFSLRVAFHAELGPSEEVDEVAHRNFDDDEIDVFYDMSDGFTNDEIRMQDLMPLQPMSTFNIMLRLHMRNDTSSPSYNASEDDEAVDPTVRETNASMSLHVARPLSACCAPDTTVPHHATLSHPKPTLSHP